MSISTRRRRWLVFGLIAAAFSLLVAGIAGAASTGKGGDGQAKMLLIAAKPGAARTVASALTSLGAQIRYRDDDLGYIRALVPGNNVDAVSKLAGVQSADPDTIVPLIDPLPTADDTSALPPPPGPTTPELNGYMPTRDIGAPQFRSAHPTYDGRGVKVAIVDSGVDLLTPELQTAKTLDGASVPKIADWVTTTDPLQSTDPASGDPTWINMATEVTATGGTFTNESVTYTAPADGPYRFGLFDERDVRLGGELGNDVNRDGNPTGSSGLFGVLWNTSTNQVWVDTNQNHSFADQAAMTDFSVSRDSGVFGTDNPATAIRESIPFVVQTDGKNKYVNIGIVSGAHGTHVAGIATGKDFFGGAFDGAAPEAQLVVVRVCMFVVGCPTSAQTEAMIYAIKHAGADVINESIGGLPALNDGNTTRDMLWNRLIDQYGTQMFLSAGNDGPGVNTQGDPAAATRSVAVGAYVTADSWHTNYGADVYTANTTKATEGGLFPFSSRGPREDGGFKPNIVAPGSAISSVPGWQPGQPVAGTYNLPPGYGMLQGTSMASPQATGGAALLISAAKQANVQWRPDQLRQAINSSATFLHAYSAHEQGNGLMNVGEAWNVLNVAGGVKTVDITSKAPVNTIISGFLAQPNFGPGIYEREGWTAGASHDRTITFTRTSGGSKAITYNLSWVGNDGTFSPSASSIALPLNTPVSLTVNVAPASAGVHSAILNLNDPATSGTDYQVLNTVVAAEQFEAASNYTISHNGTVDRADKTTYFFYVPAGAPALKVDLTNNSGRARLWRFHPYGVPFPSSSAGVTAFCTAPCTVSHTTSNPIAGVWEFTVEASRSAPADPGQFTLTASLLGVTVSPNPWVVDPTTIGTQYTQTMTFNNPFGGFTGGASGTALSSASSAHPTIAAGGAQQTYSIDVPTGATQVSAQIGNASDASADLDLFLYDCHLGPSQCVLKSQSTSGSAEESVASTNPAAGAWKVVVDPFAVPAGATTYDYLDLITKAGYGAVTVTDPVAAHAGGSSWTAPASVTPLASPGAGRFLRGLIQVTSGSTLLGQGVVELRNVTP